MRGRCVVISEDHGFHWGIRRELRRINLLWKVSRGDEIAVTAGSDA